MHVLISLLYGVGVWLSLLDYAAITAATNYDRSVRRWRGRQLFAPALNIALRTERVRFGRLRLCQHWRGRKPGPVATNASRTRRRMRLVFR
jgi:hypothetical protein